MTVEMGSDWDAWQQRKRKKGQDGERDWDGSIEEEVEGARVRDCQLLSPSELVNHS